MSFLTIDTEPFFAGVGYRPIDPDPVREGSALRVLCPRSAYRFEKALRVLNATLFSARADSMGMFGGGGGLNPRKMQKMMQQMGIELEELEASEVIITLADGDSLVFDDADVTMMEAQGQETYQIVGSPERRDASAGQPAAAEPDEAQDAAIPDDDVKLVVQRTGASADAAREALAAEDGDLAAAISRLE